MFSQGRCWGPQREMLGASGRDGGGGARERGWTENKDTAPFLFCLRSLPSGKMTSERRADERAAGREPEEQSLWSRGGEAPNLELPNGGAYGGSKPLSFGVPLSPLPVCPVPPTVVISFIALVLGSSVADFSFLFSSAFPSVHSTCSLDSRPPASILSF